MEDKRVWFELLLLAFSRPRSVHARFHACRVIWESDYTCEGSLRTVSHYPDVNTEEESDEVAHGSVTLWGTKVTGSSEAVICFHPQGSCITGEWQVESKGGAVEV